MDPDGSPMSAQDLALTSAGGIFLTALLTGIWKYRRILASPEAQAPPYVDVAHRAALLYSFACVLLAELAERSVWPNAVNAAAVLASVVFFALAIAGYVQHGWLNDTDNQFRRPHRVGTRTIPTAFIRGFMGALIVAEVGGLLVLFSGYLASLRA
jgi:hypothetical protein